MARNTSITLGPHFDEFITTQVENGRYSSASKVVRAELRHFTALRDRHLSTGFWPFDN